MKMKKTLFSEIVTLTTAIKNCEVSGNEEWYYKHSDALDKIESDHLPHGSGNDYCCKIDRESTTDHK